MKSIQADPRKRLKPELLKTLQSDNFLIDVHAHIFNYRDVPNGFLGIRLPFNQRFLSSMEHFLHRLIRRSDTDKLSNLAYFIEFFRNRTSEETTEKLIDYYPGKTLIFCPLMMDMAPGIKGKIIDPFDLQIEKMKDIRDRHPGQVMPFLAVDPRNMQVHENFIKVFSSQNDYLFNGIKVYPSLGYLPSHPELMKIYRICEQKNIPVTAHCASATVHASARRIKIRGWYYVAGKGFQNKEFTKTFRRKNDYAEFFNHPRNWRPVLREFPRLKLNLAHFGGDQQWKRFAEGKGDSWVSRIIDLMERYPNVYSDFSYTLYDRDLSQILKNMIEDNQLLASRVLYGSDYYMIVREGHFRSLRVNFSSLMGDEIMDKIARENAVGFLVGKL